jgi:hypothetical protein
VDIPSVVTATVTAQAPIVTATVTTPAIKADGLIGHVKNETDFRRANHREMTNDEIAP